MFVTALVLFLSSLAQCAEGHDAPLTYYFMNDRLYSIGQLCRAGEFVVLGRVKSKSDIIIIEDCVSLGGLRVERLLEFDSVLVTDDRRWDIDLYPKIAEGDVVVVFGFSKPIMGSINLHELLWTFGAVAGPQKDELIRKKFYPASQAGVIKIDSSESEEVSGVIKQYWNHLHNPKYDRKSFQQFLIGGLSHTNKFVRRITDIDLQNNILGSDVTTLRELVKSPLLPQQYQAFAEQTLQYKLKLPPPPAAGGHEAALEKRGQSAEPAPDAKASVGVEPSVPKP